jgi:DNA-binding transcriptional MerR regulator
VAQRAGIHVETLRYDERRGLLKEPKRRPSGYREYAPDTA